MGYRVQRDPSGAITAVFEGHLSTEDGTRSIAKFCQLAGEQPVDAVWDVSRMTGYDSGARKAWQDSLAPRRQQIRSITIVGGSALVRMGASAIALVLGISCKFLPAPAAPAPPRSPGR